MRIMCIALYTCHSIIRSRSLLLERINKKHGTVNQRVHWLQCRPWSASWPAEREGQDCTVTEASKGLPYTVCSGRGCMLSCELFSTQSVYNTCSILQSTKRHALKSASVILMYPYCPCSKTSTEEG